MGRRVVICKLWNFDCVSFSTFLYIYSSYSFLFPIASFLVHFVRKWRGGENKEIDLAKLYLGIEVRYGKHKMLISNCRSEYAKKKNQTHFCCTCFRRDYNFQLQWILWRNIIKLCNKKVLSLQPILPKWLMVLVIPSINSVLSYKDFQHC